MKEYSKTFPKELLEEAVKLLPPEEEEKPALGVLVTRCKHGFILSDEASPARTSYHAVSTLDEVLDVLREMFQVQ